MNKKFARRALWLGALLSMLMAAVPVFAAEYTERFEKTYPAAANVRVALNNVNGSIEVTGWERNEVQVVATKHADSKEKLARLEIKVQASNDSVHIKTDVPSGNNPGSVDYEIRVPRGARLDKVETVNGSVEVTDVRGMVKVSSVNGKVVGRGLTGDLDMETVNGGVDCEATDLANSRNVKLSTVNGSVEFSMPRDANAQMKAETVHGGIKSDMNLPIKNNFPVGSELNTTLGSGATHVQLSSVNGGISIKGGSKGL